MKISKAFKTLHTSSNQPEIKTESAKIICSNGVCQGSENLYDISVAEGPIQKLI
jgi:hypothetical protein